MSRAGFADETHYQLATATQTTRETDRAVLRFAPGVTLRLINAGPTPVGAFGGPAGPVDMAIEFISGGRVSVLASGFARAPTSATGLHDMVWEGELLVDSLDSFVYAAARNDTGSTVEIFLTVYGDREIPDRESP